MVPAIENNLLLGDFSAAGFTVMPVERFEVKQLQLRFGVDTVDEQIGEGVRCGSAAIIVAEDHGLDNDDAGAVF